MKRDGALTSIWQYNMPEHHSKNKIERGKVYDVIIAGGGITGITTALLLQEAGKTCVVVEANNLCFGTTGGTTAHLNTVMDTPYSTINSNFNKEASKIIAKAAK